MALLFQEKEAAEMWDAWGMEAYQLNQENRPHYILDDYLTFLRAERNPEALAKLLAMRRSRRRPFDRGPSKARSCLWSCICSKSKRAVRYYIKEETELWQSSAST